MTDKIEIQHMKDQPVYPAFDDIPVGTVFTGCWYTAEYPSLLMKISSDHGQYLHNGAWTTEYVGENVATFRITAVEAEQPRPVARKKDMHC